MFTKNKTLLRKEPILTLRQCLHTDGGAATEQPSKPHLSPAPLLGKGFLLPAGLHCSHGPLSWIEPQLQSVRREHNSLTTSW